MSDVIEIGPSAGDRAALEVSRRGGTTHEMDLARALEGEVTRAGRARALAESLGQALRPEAGRGAEGWVRAGWTRRYVASEVPADDVVLDEEDGELALGAERHGEMWALPIDPAAAALYRAARARLDAHVVEAARLLALLDRAAAASSLRALVRWEMEAGAYLDACGLEMVGASVPGEIVLAPRLGGETAPVAMVRRVGLEWATWWAPPATLGALPWQAPYRIQRGNRQAARAQGSLGVLLPLLLAGWAGDDGAARRADHHYPPAIRALFSAWLSRDPLEAALARAMEAVVHAPEMEEGDGERCREYLWRGHVWSFSAAPQRIEATPQALAAAQRLEE